MYDRKEMRKRIKEIVKFIWEYEIQWEYDEVMLLREDCLKASMYHHLRNYLKYEIERDYLRVYTEYYIKGANVFADIVIAEIDMSMTKDGNWKNATMPIAVFEMKFKGYKQGNKDFLNDYLKVKEKYEQADDVPKCDYYLCFIDEYDHGKKFFINKKHKKNFYITECTAIWNSETEKMIWASH